MKAISIKQPWAHLIATGKKTIETRTWETYYRGELLIVSSKISVKGYHGFGDLPLGQAVAVAILTDCRLMIKYDEESTLCDIYSGAYSWVLENIRQIKPFPVKGRLRIYEVEVEGDIELV